MMKIDKETLKQPQTWALLIPSILLIWTITSTHAMVKVGRVAERNAKSARKVHNNAQKIRVILEELGERNVSGAMVGEYDAITSVRDCAKAAMIPESKLSKGESSKPKLQKDGSVLYRDEYRFIGIRLLQLARFIDHAERNYTSVTCTKLSMDDAKGKRKDSWDATVDLQYYKRSPHEQSR